jgi:hypothetical protein
MQTLAQRCARPDERRIERVARQCARVVLELRREGDHDGAKRFEAAAIETVNRMRRGQL